MGPMESGISERRFWKSCALGCLAVPRALRSVVAQDVVPESAPEPLMPEEWIVDIHQHTWYLGRTDAELLRHQKVMGVWKTILLPAGRSVMRESTHSGQSNGLDATVNGNRNAYELACQHPDHLAHDHDL